MKKMWHTLGTPLMRRRPKSSSSAFHPSPPFVHISRQLRPSQKCLASHPDMEVDLGCTDHYARKGMHAGTYIMHESARLLSSLGQYTAWRKGPYFFLFFLVSKHVKLYSKKSLQESINSQNSQK